MTASVFPFARMPWTLRFWDVKSTLKRAEEWKTWFKIGRLTNFDMLEWIQIGSRILKIVNCPNSRVCSPPPPTRNTHTHTHIHARAHTLYLGASFCYLCIIYAWLSLILTSSLPPSPTHEHFFPSGRRKLCFSSDAPKPRLFPPKLITLSPSGKRDANLYYLSLHQSSWKGNWYIRASWNSIIIRHGRLFIWNACTIYISFCL